MSPEEIIEYYAGSPSKVTTDSGTKANEGKASEETQVILTVAVMVTVLVVLITVFHMVAGRCRQAEMRRKGDLVAESWDEADSEWEGAEVPEDS